MMTELIETEIIVEDMMITKEVVMKEDKINKIEERLLDLYLKANL
jgi:hypothetical protein